MLLHIFAHIDADDSILRIKEILGQYFRQIGLAHTCRSKEDECSDGLVGILQTGAVPADGLGNLHHRFVLPNDNPLQFGGHAHQTLTFVLGDTLHGYACHHGNYLCHSVFRNIGTVFVHAVFPRFLNHLSLFLQHLDLVAVFGGLVVLLVANRLHFQLLLFLDGGLCCQQFFGNVDVLDMQTRTRFVHHIDGFVGEATV